MIPHDPMTTVTALLGTYLIHSTCLIVCAVVLHRLIGRRRTGLREVIWRAALFGPLLTAPFQVLTGVEPIGGTLALATDSLNSSSSLVAARTTAHPAPAFRVEGEGAAAVGDADTGPWSSEKVEAADPRNAAGLLPGVKVGIGIIWLAGAAAGFWRLLSSSRRLRRLMEGRTPRPAGRIIRHLAHAMGLGRAPRVSTSRAFAAPFATGVRHPEICLPDRIVVDLQSAGMEGLLAHEMAHLSRRDPGWRLAHRVVESLFFFQPLNGVARRRLEEISELLSDARAVAHTGDRLGLADCLVDLASWTTDNPDTTLAVVAAAKGPSITARIQHLLDGSPEETTMPKWTVPAVSVAIFAAALAFPTVAPLARVAFDEAPAPQAATADAPEAAPPAPAAVPAPAAPPTVAAPPAVPAPESAPRPAPEAAAAPSAPRIPEATHRELRRRVVELQALEEKLRAERPIDEERLAEVAETEARLKAEIAAKRAKEVRRSEDRMQRATEARERAEARTRDRARKIEEGARRRAEHREQSLQAKESAMQRAEAARIRALVHKEAAARRLEGQERALELQEEALLRHEAEVRAQVARRAERMEDLELRLKALEERERALLEREKTLEKREREMESAEEQ